MLLSLTVGAEPTLYIPPEPQGVAMSSNRSDATFSDHMRKRVVWDKGRGGLLSFEGSPDLLLFNLKRQVKGRASRISTTTNNQQPVQIKTNAQQPAVSP